MASGIVSVVLSILVLSAAAPYHRDSPTSPALARRLAALMLERGLQTVAARDPDAPDRFVAAMAFPDVQLLVVAARHGTPSLIQDQLGQKKFREVYAELQTASIQQSKLFFQDMGGDGIGGSSDNVDVMYEHGTDQTLFDGDWKRARLSKAAYEKRIADADASYSRLLEILVTAIAKPE
jgi:hypothetical protein